MTQSVKKTESIAQLSLPFFPGPAIRHIQEAPNPRLALGSTLICAVFWSLLSWQLCASGHRPSGPALFEPHYCWQAAYLPLILPLQWLLYSVLAQSFARRLGGAGEKKATSTALGIAFGLPLLLGFILPDGIAYFLGGFHAMAKVLPFTGPLTLLWILALSTRCLSVLHKISTPRALCASFFAFVIQAIPMGLFIR